MRFHHIALGVFFYFIGGSNLTLYYCLFLCYYLFSKGFMETTYCFRLIELYGLIGEFKSKKIVSDTKLKRTIRIFIDENPKFSKNSERFHQGKHKFNREKYLKTVSRISPYAFIFLPFLVREYLIYGKKIRQLKKVLK